MRSDIFRGNVKDDWLAQCFIVMRSAAQHQHYVLTKRPERMAEYLADRSPLLNVRLGVTAENQEWFDRRVAVLMRLAEQGWRTFVSLEPLLEPVDMRRVCRHCDGTNQHQNDCPQCDGYCHVCRGELRVPWDSGDARPGEVFVGPETGPARRPCPHDWLRSVVEQCRAAGVRCLVKAVSEHEDGSGKILRPGSAAWPGWAGEKEE